MGALLGLRQPHQASALPLLAFDECSVWALPAATTIDQRLSLSPVRINAAGEAGKLWKRKSPHSFLAGLAARSA
jgi:hypothetical protein